MDLLIGVVLGSTRPGRRGAAIADWMMARTAGRPGAQYELIDIAEYDLPLLDEPAQAAVGQYTKPHTIRWSQEIDRFDGFVFVTPEYNRSTSAALKNAIDFLYREWNGKAAAFVSYGSVGGARAIEHLRGIAAAVELAGIPRQLNFFARVDFDAQRNFAPGEHNVKLAALMLDQLETWATALRSTRTAPIPEDKKGN
ncbi:NADPH-dependent FMN reductase [Diaminobutyricibacter sp. McL0618]|uniref:NADPH-dependent FMN reductase n=1 Tax=Leifsonia sp. McL0618 TaxID=3415677 RepID=UPI003CF5F9D7